MQADSPAKPALFVVAGPNGSGKSTLTRNVWAGIVAIIDPDAIARDLAGSTMEAGREALARRSAALGEGRSHLLESTLAGSSMLRHMEAGRAAGFHIELHFVCLPSVELNLARIACRVSQGGHDIPEADVRRRFERSQDNLPEAILLADTTMLYDNSSASRPHQQVACIEGDSVLTADDAPEWATVAIALAARTSKKRQEVKPPIPVD